MILFNLFPIFLYAKSISIKGKWKDSSLKNEAIIFFEKNEPSLLDKVKSTLEEIDEDQSQILNSLSKIVDQPLFGLLNLSLSLRFYQPIASIRSPKKGHPLLHGWHLFEKQNINLNLADVQNVHFSMINSLDRYKKPIEKLEFLKNSSFSISSLIKSTKNRIFAGTKQIINKYPHGYYYSAINGRIVKHHYFDILDGLLEEYRFTKLFSFSKALLYKNGYRKPHYFTNPYPYMQVLMPHNIDKLRSKWSEEPKITSKDYWDILKCKKHIATVDIIFDLRSPESPALLNWAKEHALNSSPLYFNITFNFDIHNETEKYIAYAWHQSVDTLGVRNAVIFMVDGFKRNNFKRAYKATLPTLSWKGLKGNMASGHKHTSRILSELNYCKEKKITVGAAINGEFIQERPIFPVIENKLFSYITRIKKVVQDGNKIDFSQILEWTANNSIQMETSTPPVDITYNNYISIHGFSNEVINSTATKIISLANENSEGSDSLKYPVIVLNNIKKKKSQYNADISEFTDEEIQLLKVNRNEVFTIVGPLVFQGVILTSKQLKFAQDYIDYVFLTRNLESDLSDKNILLSLFFRSTNALDGVWRQPIRNNLPDLLKVELSNGSPLTWQIVEDPFTFQGPLILDMATRVYNSGAANIIFYPNVNHDEYKSVIIPFSYRFHSAFDKDKIEFNSNLYFVRTSSYWSTLKKEKENGEKIELTCTSVLTSSILNSKGKSVKISDSLVTSTNDIGFFSPILPIGKYNAEGISSKSYESEKSFYVDSFVPHLRFYFHEDEKFETVQSNSYLNIVLRPENDSITVNNDIKILLYTILNNTKEETQIKLYISTPFPFDQIKSEKVETIVIPSFLPHFYQMRLINTKQLVNNWKFILSDIYLPNNGRYLFLDTRMIFLGDASRFMRLDMSDDAVVAAPIMTDGWLRNRGKEWNSRKYLMMRYKRPYHASSLIWIDMSRWAGLHIGDRFRMILSTYIEANNHFEKIGEIIFNSIQLYAQFITLPEEIAFNSNRSPPRLAKKALSLELSSNEATRLAKIKYEKIKQAALHQFA